MTEEGRVDGNLNLSRALGDLRYKSDRSLLPAQQKVCGVPDVTVLDLDASKDEYVVLGCDGIWELVNNEQMVAGLNEKIQRRVQAQ